MNPDEYPKGWSYIGDGIYARYDGFGVWTACQRDNGWHSIYFEPSVLKSLNKFYAEATADPAVDAKSEPVE